MSAAPHDARPAVVAIDGPSGAGKSTVARRVAARLGWRYLDTGAMYRAIAWRALQDGIDPGDGPALTDLVDRVHLELGTQPRRPRIAVDGVDVTRAVRGRDVTNVVSLVSAVPGVRDRMVHRQRAEIAAGPIVVEGRDIGTTVAPDAPVKVFLTASGAARAQRRHRQLTTASGEAASGGTEVTRAEQDRRDALDSSRLASPLARATDAVEIDSTTLDVGGVVRRVLALCRSAGFEPPARRGGALA